MKPKVITALFVLLFATTSVIAADAPAVEAQLSQLNPAMDMFTFRGPVSVQYQLTIKNPLVDQSITLRRVTLRTQGRGAYSLRANDPSTWSSTRRARSRSISPHRVARAAAS